MQLKYSRWVFNPSEMRLPEENERWWNECYLPHPIQNFLENRERWCVLLGKYRSGKSTALTALSRKMERRALVIQDEIPENGQDAAEKNLLHRILGRASWMLRQDLNKAPSKFSMLSPTHLEFLRWSVEKFHGRRAFARWLDGFPPEISQSLHDIPFEDIYPSQTSDIEGQIEELTNLCAKLGYQQVLAIIDTPPFPTTDQEKEIHHILSWLEPMQHALKVAMALPLSYTSSKVRELSRGRVDVLELEPNPKLEAEIISRHLMASTNETIQKVEQLGSPKLIAQIKDFAQRELGPTSVGTWLNIIETILEEADLGSSFPLAQEAFPRIKLAFYKRFMPLRLGPENENPGVWRGYKWIPLDRAVYDFLSILLHHEGKHIDHEIVKTTKSNLHTLARRLRVAIEPDPSQSIYLKNSKGEGYWLEKTP